jgi:hypothetical protein
LIEAKLRRIMVRSSRVRTPRFRLGNRGSIPYGLQKKE